jgi:large subunit ribosomal protein L24
MTGFSTTWKKSTQPRKQHKYRYTAPLHVKQKLVHVHLSSELKKKHGLRNVQIKKGDKIKVSRGQHKKKEGKVERVSVKREKVYITGIEFIKKDGAKTLVALSPSNLIIVELDLSDKKRKQKLTKKDSKSVPKVEQAKKQDQKETKQETKQEKQGNQK